MYTFCALYANCFGCLTSFSFYCTQATNCCFFLLLSAASLRQLASQTANNNNNNTDTNKLSSRL